MIAFDFVYVQPTTISEATALYTDFVGQGKTVHYYGGGTEFISEARTSAFSCDVVIDIKGIPELRVQETIDDELVIGAAVTLTELTDSHHFPLLARVARGIATRTARNKITIGGNVRSSLPYKEACLPLLLANSVAVIADLDGLHEVDVDELIQNGLRQDAFIVQFKTKTAYTIQPYAYVKKTKHSRVGYPVVTIAAMQVDDAIQIALSGVTNQPFCSTQLAQSVKESVRLEDVIPDKQGPVMDDFHASQAYRVFLTETCIEDAVQQLKGSVT